jgi:hypothetical protein
MYYWLPPSQVNRAGALRAVVTEWNVCHACGHEYHGSTCNAELAGGAICHEPFDPRQSRRTARLWLILLGGPIAFERQARLRCTNRRDHFCKGALPARAEFFKQVLGAQWQTALGPGWEFLAPADLDAGLPPDWEKRLLKYWDSFYPLSDDFEKWRAARRLLKDRKARDRARDPKVFDSEFVEMPPELSDDELEEVPDSQYAEVPPELADSKLVELLRANADALRRNCACALCGQEPSNKARPTHVWVWP